MRKMAMSVALAMLGVYVAPVSADSKEDVKAAAKKLSDASSYSWKATTESSGRFQTGPVEGKTKDGVIQLSLSIRDNTTQAFVKGEQGAVETSDGWQSLSELAEGEGRGRFLVFMLRGYQTPAEEAAEIVGNVKDLKEEDGALAGELTEDGVKALMRFGRRRGNNGGPSVRNANGSAKFWIKDGTLVKYEYKVSGTVTFGDNDRDVDRTVTVEIKDVDSTEIQIPDAAKEKLS